MDENKYTQTFTEGRGFPNESLGYDGITNAIGGVDVFRNKTKTRNLSYMARARYDFLNKYQVVGTVRRDGSSVNAADFKWTTNPAIGLSWKAHNEEFIQNLEKIQELKLRVTYGSLINSLSTPYTSLFTAEGQNYVFDGESASGYSPSVVLPNPKLDMKE